VTWHGLRRPSLRPAAPAPGHSARAPMWCRAVAQQFEGCAAHAPPAEQLKADRGMLGMQQLPACWGCSSSRHAGDAAAPAMLGMQQLPPCWGCSSTRHAGDAAAPAMLGMQQHPPYAICARTPRTPPRPRGPKLPPLAFRTSAARFDQCGRRACGQGTSMRARARRTECARACFEFR
jgi:hypothetical protein